MINFEEIKPKKRFHKYKVLNTMLNFGCESYIIFLLIQFLISLFFGSSF
jgi:hypothetical protein